MQRSDLNIFLQSSYNLLVANFSFDFKAYLIKSISVNLRLRMVKGVVSFKSSPRCFYIIARFIFDLQSVFAQVIILCGSQHYISLIDRSIKNTVVTGASKQHSFREVSSKQEKGMCLPLYFCHLNQMYEPQYICEKYFLTLLILLKLDILGVKLIQYQRKTLTLINVLYLLLTLYKNDLERSFTFRVFFVFKGIFNF